MPKQVDHAQRREEVAGALWRLVVRDGVEGASLRRVAAEAGWSAGSLRHYFATQSELLAFAMDLVTERARRRLLALPGDADASTTAARLLEEVLPLDGERRAEMQVWLAFTMRALVDPALRGRREQAHADLRELCRSAVLLLGLPEPERETERLHALIDGLALHAILDPHTTTPHRQVELLSHHIDRLAGSSDARRSHQASRAGPRDSPGPRSD